MSQLCESELFIPENLKNMMHSPAQLGNKTWRRLVTLEIALFKVNRTMQQN